MWQREVGSCAWCWLWVAGTGGSFRAGGHGGLPRSAGGRRVERNPEGRAAASEDLGSFSSFLQNTNPFFGIFLSKGQFLSEALW